MFRLIAIGVLSITIATACARSSGQEITSRAGADHDAAPRSERLEGGAAVVVRKDASAIAELPDASPAGASRDAESATDAGFDAAGAAQAALDCYRYFRAFCERNAECRHLPVVSEGCLAAATDCRLFSLGQLRPNADLRECSDEYASFDCDHVLRGRSLECVGPGELEAGERCSLSLSCRSLSCRSRPGEGLFCAERVGFGEPCPVGTVCSRGESCIEGTCAPSPPPDLTNGNWPLGDVGEVCFDPHQCREGLVCLFESSATDGYGACGVAPGADQPCAYSRDYDWATPLPVACDSSNYCDEGSCVPLPDVGQPCAPSRFVDQPPCAWGAFCDSEANVCQPWLALGELCVPSPRLSGLSGLPLDPPCDPTQGGRCSCPAEQSECDVEQRRCLVRVEPGGRCDSDLERCELGSRCIDGACRYPGAL